MSYCDRCITSSSSLLSSPFSSSSVSSGASPMAGSRRATGASSSLELVPRSSFSSYVDMSVSLVV